MSQGALRRKQDLRAGTPADWLRVPNFANVGCDSMTTPGRDRLLGSTEEPVSTSCAWPGYALEQAFVNSCFSAVGPVKKSFSTDAPVGALGSGLAISACLTTFSLAPPSL